MNKKIQSQVLKEKFKYLFLKKVREEHRSNHFSYDDVDSLISRTIELMEEKFRSKNVKEINNWVKIMKIKSWDNLLIETKEKQKAEFKKMIQDLENPYPKDIFEWNNKEKLDFSRGRFNRHCFEIVENMREKLLLLSKLGDNHSSQSVVNPSNSQRGHFEDGTSKGCGKALVGEYALICRSPLLCASCRIKEGTCICGHLKSIHHRKRISYKLTKKEYCEKCKCKKFQEVGG